MQLSQLRAKSRLKLDEVSEGFWTDDELDGYIGESYFDLWQIMLNAKHQGTLKTDLLDIVGGTAEIPLPTDFSAARLVERVIDGGTVPLWWEERFDQPNYTTGITSGYRFNVRFVGQNLVCEPTPSDSQTDGIKLTYYFFPEQLEDDIDTPNAALHAFYHDLIPYGAVVIAKSKEEMVGGGGADLGPWGALMQAKLERFKASVELPSVTRQAVEPFEMGDC